MDPVDRISNNFIRSLSKSTVYQYPFRHWVLANSLPLEVLESIIQISVEAPSTETLVGTQRSEFEGRFFFSPNNRFIFPVCDEVARAFQALKVIQAIEACADIKLTNTQLRIEYTQDCDGYFLEPHTYTIDPKIFTLVITLPRAPHLEAMGTDLYDTDHNYVSTQPKTISGGLAFVPDTQTWHGFEKKQIEGIRRSLIVNYVGEGWPQTIDLSFPELMVGHST